jgi:hypothetical protein
MAVLSAEPLVVAHPVLLLLQRSRGRASSERTAHPALVRASRSFRLREQPCRDLPFVAASHLKLVARGLHTASALLGYSPASELLGYERRLRTVTRTHRSGVYRAADGLRGHNHFFEARRLRPVHLQTLEYRDKRRCRCAWSSRSRAPEAVPVGPRRSVLRSD